MILLLRDLISPLLSLTFLMLANGFFGTFISVRMQLDGYNATWIGFVHSAYYVGFLIGAVKSERLISRIRHIRAFAAFASLATASILLQGLWLDVYAWIVIRLFYGFCISALYVVIESWFLVISPTHLRGRVLSVYMVGLYVAQSLSQFFLDVINPSSLTPFLLIGCLSALSITPVCITTTNAPELHAPRAAGILPFLRHSPLGVIGCILSGFLLSGIYGFTPIFAHNLDLSVSWIMFLSIAGGFLFQWPIGHLSDLLPRRLVLILISFASAIPAFLMAWAVANPYYVYLLSFILGGLVFTIYPISITYAVDRLHPEHITTASGVLLLAYGVGAILGPLIVPYFIEAFIPAGLYIFLGGTSTILGIVGLISWLKVSGVPIEKQVPFVPLQPATPVAYELDPRETDKRS